MRKRPASRASRSFSRWRRAREGRPDTGARDTAT
jgi:hypothetical protein